MQHRYLGRRQFMWRSMQAAVLVAVWGVYFFCATISGAESARLSFSVVQKEGSLTLSYSLANLDGADDFFTRVENMSRAGHDVQVMHTIMLERRAAYMWESPVGYTVQKKLLHFNLYDNSWAYGENPDQWQVTRDMNEVHDYVFSLERFPVKLQEKLSTGDTYTFTLSLNIMGEDNGWRNWLYFTPVFGDGGLETKVDYLAR